MSTSMTIKQEVPDQTKGRARDQAWAHVTTCVGEKGQQILVCNFCDKAIGGGGINRFKKHLAGIKGEVGECEKVDPDVKEAIQASLKDDKHTKNDDEEQVRIKGLIQKMSSKSSACSTSAKPPKSVVAKPTKSSPSFQPAKSSNSAGARRATSCPSLIAKTYRPLFNESGGSVSLASLDSSAAARRQHQICEEEIDSLMSLMSQAKGEENLEKRSFLMKVLGVLKTQLKRMYPTIRRYAGFVKKSQS